MSGDMIMESYSSNSLANNTDNSDQGDEIARRFRYQWTYAAILCCMLLDDTQDIEEIFCEHFEDILLKHTDGQFTGLQIKTRATNQLPWKSNDEEVKRTLIKFAIIDNKYPSSFRSFSFLTNHPLFSSKNGKDISFILDEIKNAITIDEVAGPTFKYIKEIATKTNCSEAQIFTTLKKTKANHDLPKLEDVSFRLINSLTDVWETAKESSIEAVKHAAFALIEECGRASALAHYDLLPAYISAINNSREVELNARLKEKKIDKPRLLNVLQKGIDGTIPLYCDPNALIEPGTGQTILLRKKLDAGGFSAVSLNSAEDLRDRADYLGIVLIQKHGHLIGLQKYNALSAMVLRDAADAFEVVKRDDPFGVEMLFELRKNFSQRQAKDIDLFGCTDEHLEGLAYSLTSQCKIYWSKNHPWEDK
jgi:hypothetical protein